MKRLFPCWKSCVTCLYTTTHAVWTAKHQNLMCNAPNSGSFWIFRMFTKLDSKLGILSVSLHKNVIFAVYIPVPLSLFLCRSILAVFQLIGMIITHFAFRFPEIATYMTSVFGFDKMRKYLNCKHKIEKWVFNTYIHNA